MSRYNDVLYLMIDVLPDQTIQLDAGVSWVKANAGQTGLYRVNYDVLDWIQFVTMLRDDHIVSVCVCVCVRVRACVHVYVCHYCTMSCITVLYVCLGCPMHGHIHISIHMFESEPAKTIHWMIQRTHTHAHAHTHTHTHTYIHTRTHTQSTHIIYCNISLSTFSFYQLVIELD